MKEVIYYKKENWKIPINKVIEIMNKKNEKMLAKFYYKLDLLKLGLL